MRQLERLDPNIALAAAAVAIVATEAAYRTWISDAWLLLEALVAAVALFHAWREQDRLRLGPVLAVIGGLQLALFGVHVALDVVGDKDSSVVYRWQGNALGRGDYPRSEYPLGAVLLFGLEAWLGGGTTRNANALLMAPLAVLTSAAVWLTRMPYAPWLAALIGFWPANSFYWQYKFDLAPAALLVVGLVLALRGRWGLSGAVLAVGALVKWTPALAVVALVAWLLTTRRVREAMMHAGAFAATLVLVYVPFIVWSQSEVLAAYERQSGRSITPESVWYLLLRPFDLAHVRTHISFSAGAPRWANVGAGLLQAAVVARARRRGSARAHAACRGRPRRARSRRVPADEPDLQPAVHARRVRGVGARGGARRADAARAAVGRRGDGRGGARERVRLPVRASALRRHVGAVLVVFFSLSVGLTAWLARRAGSA